MHSFPGRLEVDLNDHLERQLVAYFQAIAGWRARTRWRDSTSLACVQAGLELVSLGSSLMLVMLRSRRHFGRAALKPTRSC